MASELNVTTGGGEAAARRRSGPSRAQVVLGVVLACLAFAISAAAYRYIGQVVNNMSSDVQALAVACAIILLSVPLFMLGRQLARRGFPDTRPAYPLQLSGSLLAYYAIFFIVPMAVLVIYSFGYQSLTSFSAPFKYGFIDTFTTDSYAKINDPVVWKVFRTTVQFATVGTTLTILFGYPLAYWIVRFAAPKKRNLMLLLVVIPFWTSFLIRTYSFLIVLAPGFFLMRWITDITGQPVHILYTDPAVQLGIVYNYLPLLVLPVYASLERMDWTLVDAAMDLGASPFRAFYQVTLRLTAPGLITGALLVFIPMMGEYVIPKVLGGGKVLLMGNLIASSFLEAQDYAFGAALALFVMAALSVFMFAYLWLSIRTEQQYGA